jgi:phosphatidylglycerophosphatase A
MQEKRNYLSIPDIPKSMWKNPWHFIAFGFGSGAIPFAPGTFGTLFAIPFYLVAHSFSPNTYALITAFVVLISIVICEKTSQSVNEDDHQGMCLDEFAGFFVTMLYAPQGAIWVLYGFILFRLFDIWKPWPIRFFDKSLHGGFGMIFDDVLAGLFGFVIIQFLATLVS